MTSPPGVLFGVVASNFILLSSFYAGFTDIVC